MRTTLNLPDELMRAVKIRAIEANQSLQSTIADLLRCGLRQSTAKGTVKRKRVRLPLIQGGHPAAPDEEMTAERIAQILLDEESRGFVR